MTHQLSQLPSTETPLARHPHQRPRFRAFGDPEAGGRHRSLRSHPLDPSRSITPRSSSADLDLRHTMHPPVACLGRPLLIRNVSKGRRRFRECPNAPPGGRFWHGFAVRRPQLGGSGWGLTFGPISTAGHPMQRGLSLHLEGVDRKAAPTFFTERSLAAYLAVSDRTIRNWIRRGDLPSYKLGASRRIDPADVEDFLARHRDEAA